MRITSTTLRVADPPTDVIRLGDLLGLPIDGDVVRVGWTAIRPVATTGDGVDHLAILVPGDAFDDAVAWLGARTPLLDRDGLTEFAGPPGWHSRSVYFDGPDGVVLELIAHAGHRTDAPATFPEALLGVCEVGIAVPDVRAAAAASGLPVFAGTLVDDFGALGDRDGRLILAAPGRGWLPTTDRVAGLAPAEVRATDVDDARLGDARLARE